ncbi:hypothetical protein QAD02_022916 [Eretmocerus hayati]|uniref:Uncharacterized protein n=2 Tax=Eretmocerus hayati TaxID=131215 RepID=A0ACC2PVY9_9HYME|nr:hypothetical protein QAD02_022912 [Eretmocerus hayati]KAJ8687122.1 hypothetical protein QAD02_022916 [Eretmocerus hayati]
MIADEDGPGALQIVEIVPFKMVVNWELYLNWNIGDEGEYLESCPFGFHDLSGNTHEWQLSFCYKSSDECGCANHNCLSIVHLENAEPGKCIFAIKFRVSIGFAGARQYIYDDTLIETSPQNFAEKSKYAITVSHRSMKNDPLKISCFIIACHDVNEHNNIFQNEHHILLSQDQELLFESGKFSDVTFIVGEQEFKLHKSILSSRSVYFAAMFNNDCKESINNKVNVEDQSHEVMKEFFRYIYAGKVNKIEIYALELLKIADMYAVIKLKSVCEQTLVKALENENVVEYLNIADKYSAKKLETECIRYIITNIKEIVDLPAFHLDSIPAEHRDRIFKAVAKMT